MTPVPPGSRNSRDRTATVSARGSIESFTPSRAKICVSWWSRLAIVAKCIGRPSNEALHPTPPQVRSLGFALRVSSPTHRSVGGGVG